MTTPMTTPIVVIVPAPRGGFRWAVLGTRLVRGVEPTRFYAREKALLALEAQGYRGVEVPR